MLQPSHLYQFCNLCSEISRSFTHVAAAQAELGRYAGAVDSGLLGEFNAKLVTTVVDIAMEREGGDRVPLELAYAGPFCFVCLGLGFT